jgi:16S rRNA A1518/A1519 N6-dimethyltransferase RsmA/KsgA/DIM1 with predicted DNA glycosylase/AP lyase activity
VFEKVVKAAFSARRKMLRNTLAAGLRVEVDLAEAAARASGIHPEDRPERIPLQGYVELTRHLKGRFL